jgi:hypothetical protein
MKEERKTAGSWRVRKKVVYCGKEFWTHVTGDENLYFELLKAFSDCVDKNEIQGVTTLQMMVDGLAEEMELAVPA